MEKLSSRDIYNSDLIKETFNFWYSDHEHIRSPFPQYIRIELKEKTIGKFHSWLSSLSDNAQKDVTQEIILDKLESIVFDLGLELAMAEDEKLTILYPFMPRIDDIVQPDPRASRKEESKVIERSLLSEGDHKFIMVKFEGIQTNTQWEARFELPA